MSDQSKPVIDVCFSPALLHLYDTAGAIVVIIDIFRATSTITAALHNGATRVIPVASVAECIALGSEIEGSITAGERDGKIAEGLAHGNSPSEYPAEFISGRTLILTTTNGTRLLHMVENAAEIVIGSFLNLTAVCDYLKARQMNVLLGCASWKDRFNLEDTLFAGAVIAGVKDHFEVNSDSAKAANYLFERSGGDFLGFLKDSAHYKRLSVYGLEDDMAYCATPDIHPVVPVLKGRELVI